MSGIWGYGIFFLDWIVQTKTIRPSELCMSKGKKWWKRKIIFEPGKYFTVQKNILSWKWIHFPRIILKYLHFNYVAALEN